MVDPHRADIPHIKVEGVLGTSESGRAELESAQTAAPASNGEGCGMVGGWMAAHNAPCQAPLAVFHIPLWMCLGNTAAWGT